MKINIYKKCVLFDKEMVELWAYLRSCKVNCAMILREATKQALKQKATEMKFKPKKDFCPF